MLPRLSVALVVLAVACGCSGSSSTSSSTASTPAAASSSATPPASTAMQPMTSTAPAGEDVRIAADLPPLPPGLMNAARPPAVVRAAYEFAARHPEVLKYVPCFCSCERMGHRGNEDCFVSSRDAAGHVTAWEPHGMICEVCLDVARESMQMHNSGASTSAIRAAIEKKYASPDRGHTPTPMPPRGGQD